MHALPAVLLLTVLAVAAPAAAEDLLLPVPPETDVTDLLDDVGARPDRVLTSVVPGPVRNDEVVRTGLAGDGSVQEVALDQALQLTGTGDYQVSERGPARSARALGDEPPPVTKFGAVVWQGFSPGRRALAARLVLDPVLEAPRLPLRVELSFAAPGRPAVPLGPQGAVPGPGRVTVRLVAQTAQPATLPTATDAAPGPVAAALDALRRPPGSRLAVPRRGLPASVPATGVGQRAGTAAVPLRVTGLLTAPGAVVAGPGTTPVPDGARLAGTLSEGSVAFTVDVPGPGALRLDLQAVPALDPRGLVPPGGAASWRAWAASGPSLPARRAALETLVGAAASGARAAAYAPYLGADLPGTGSTVFRFGLAAAPPRAVVREALRARPGARALAALAGLLVLTGAGALWRAS